MNALSPSPSIQTGFSPSRAAIGALLGLTQGFGLYLVSNNLGAIQGSLGATAAEASWLTTAYFATALWASLLITKIRLQVGLRIFTVASLWLFLGVAVLHQLADNLGSALAVRAALGLAAAPLSTLAIYYMLEALPPRWAPVALLAGFTFLQLPGPLSRVLAPDLLVSGRWQGLFLLDVALALLSLAAIHAVPLKPQPRQPVFGRGDLLSVPLYAVGLVLLCVVVSQGRLAWWADAPWLGACLAGAIACLGLYVLVDLNRVSPLLDLRWLTQPYMLRFVAGVLLFRIVLSEQNVGVVGLMSALGQTNEQMQLLFALVSVGLVAGFALAPVIAARCGTPWLSVLAAALVVVAAVMDSEASALSRPEQFHLSQGLMAVALGLFFSASLLLGFGPVMAEGGQHLVSLLAAFSGAQLMGSLFGSAWASTFVAQRQTWHVHALTEQMATGNPLLAQQVAHVSGWAGQLTGDPVSRAQQGLALLLQQITRESTVLAYNDLFQRMALLAAAMTLWLTVLAWRAHRRRVHDSGTSPSSPASPPASPPASGASTASASPRSV
ncbi:MFS transporter [Roseateles amylovorans]|uniref:MFS transporter n=1 Tax=Roseateles amylovorans TaxID=2978473 RepID=A0ABY6B5C1_9BURK|nr:MFS transporter [Roseateles amylovorans]UXH79946.1 MFS transporter [Roseateles amylovorans]